jgi:hypothetical protein
MNELIQLGRETFEFGALNEFKSINANRGYVMTTEGIKKDKGGHFDRNKAKYIGAALAAPSLGTSLMAGALADKQRKSIAKKELVKYPYKGGGPTKKEKYNPKLHRDL